MLIIAAALAGCAAAPAPAPKVEQRSERQEQAVPAPVQEQRPGRAVRPLRRYPIYRLRLTGYERWVLAGRPTCAGTGRPLDRLPVNRWGWDNLRRRAESNEDEEALAAIDGIIARLPRPNRKAEPSLTPKPGWVDDGGFWYPPLPPKPAGDPSGR